MEMTHEEYMELVKNSVINAERIRILYDYIQHEDINTIGYSGTTSNYLKSDIVKQIIKYPVPTYIYEDAMKEYEVKHGTEKEV